MKEQILACARTAFSEAQDLTISDPVRISEGWETEIYSFDFAYKADGEPRRELLILRIFPGQGTGPQAVKEFNAMKRLFLAGYPVPLVLHQGGEDSPFGKPFILMERITLIKQQMPAHRRVYDLLLERTGIQIAEVEQMFMDFF